MELSSIVYFFINIKFATLKVYLKLKNIIKMKLIKGIVLIASMVLFGIQLNTAIDNLFNPQTVDSTKEVDSKEVDLPLITLCPTNQINKVVLRKFGYYFEESMMMGYTSKSCYWKPCVSWGAQQNLSFNEMLKKIYSIPRLNIESRPSLRAINNSVYLPGFGLCSEIYHFDPAKKLRIFHHQQRVRVFITDRQYRS